jgi:exodeoxyribonuclease VII large subunit
MRGGGSLESFQAFNNEVLVRAVADFPAPVLTGIGHDKDAPLVSMVSDRNVSTPTAVANLLNTTWADALSEVILSHEKIFSRFSAVLKDKQFFIENSVVRMEGGIKFVANLIKVYTDGVLRGFKSLVEDSVNFLNQAEKTIDMQNPVRQLSQGYSIIKSGGKVLKSKKNAKTGDKLDIMLADGTIQSQII